MAETMESVELARWQDHFHDWAARSRGPLSGSPDRNELTIEGEIRFSKLSDPIRFKIGTARDHYGSVLHVTPGQPNEIVQSSNKDGANQRKWNQWWAKIAVRAGYLCPSIDPVAFARLSSLRRDQVRVEFIVDTNVLISGIGHWLVRWLGDRADLVRTVVTDLELQRFADAGIWRIDGFKPLAQRASYLSSCRFLEYLNDRHPIWRRIDIAEETALFMSKASEAGKKDPGSDTLMLRAARRLIQDEVPGLVRLFVTADQALARAASHELPANATIAAYVNPIPDVGVHLGSLHWWPGGDEKQGQGHLATLADFLYESTCLCDRIIVKRSDDATLTISGYVPGANQFPSDWRRPLVWFKAEEGTSAENRTEKRPKIVVETVSPAKITISTTPDRPAVDGSENWPLKMMRVLDKHECAARVQASSLFDATFAIMVSARDKRKLTRNIFHGSESSVRALKTFLRCTELLEDGDSPGLASYALIRIFEENDHDSLSELFTSASHYAHFIEGLCRGSMEVGSGDVPERSFNSLAAIARMLGQAVRTERETLYGGGYVTGKIFADWLVKSLTTASMDNPLREVPIADLAQKALMELQLSPVRFGMALDAALKFPELKNIEPISGGTPEDVLAETVVVLSSEGWRQQRVSADGLLGYRTLKRSAQ
jgi:hypothetical protein